MEIGIQIKIGRWQKYPIKYPTVEFKNSSCMDMCQKYHHYLPFEDKKVRLYPPMVSTNATFDSLESCKSVIWLHYQKSKILGRIRYLPSAYPQDSLAFAALRHVAPSILGRVLLPSAAKKVGLDPPMKHLTLLNHVNQ